MLTPFRVRGATVSRLGWYARRLGTMTPREMLWRSRRVAAELLPMSGRYNPTDVELFGVGDPLGEQALRRFREGVGRPVLLDADRAAVVARENPAARDAVVEAADRACQGRFGFFGYPEVVVGRSIDWNFDTVAGIRWPLVAASKINHRTAVGDPKWIWELQRLQHLSWLAQAWLFTRNERYAETALDHLDSWIEQNPPGVGIGWRGAFEPGIRAISVSIALQGIRDCPALTPDRFRRIVCMLFQSARRCMRERSRFSSANNHLVGELAGLATVALLFPDVGIASRWEDATIDALVTEANKQILSDGVGAEMAVGYQVFTAELLLVVAVLLDLRDGRPPAPMVDAVNRSANYLAALVGDRDPDPRYGDDDEGFALRLGPEQVRSVRDHLGAVAAFTGNTAAAAVGKRTLSSGWLCSGRQVCVKEPDPSSFVALQGGMAVLRTGDRRLTMDIGPLGYLAPAAHGHADALSVTVSAAGIELIGDPGTASYYGHPEWRTVHRGTRIHATVSVDGLDQSVIGGPFLWTRHARVRVRSVDLARGVVDAEHDGYRRLSDPVTHRRCLVVPPGWRSAAVLDLVTGRGTHEIRTSWPLPPTLDIAPAGSEHIVTHDGVSDLQMLHGGSQELIREEVRGDEARGLGWWSSRLESREASWLVGARTVGPMPVALVTVLHAPADLDRRATNLDVALVDRALTASWSEGDIDFWIEMSFTDGSVRYGDSSSMIAPPPSTS